MTQLSQALLVELRDERGDPVVNHVLRFSTEPIDPNQQFFGAYTAYVSRVDRNEFSNFASDETDEQGRARVLVRLGTKAGPAVVTVTNPDDGTSVTATFTVQAGNAVRVLASPEDTSIYVGRTMTIRSSVVDQFGNPRNDPVTHTVTGNAVTLSGSTVTGAALGTATIVTTAGDLVGATATVTVPPEGVLAAFTPRGLATFKTDGSDFRVLVPAPLTGITTIWSPSGAEVAFDHSFTGPTRIADLSGGVRTVTPGNLWSIYPDYSSDGQWIYYTRDGWRLYRVHPDGTGDEILPMTAPATDAAPSVAPNGTQLVYVRIGGGDQLWMLDLATGASTNLNVPGHQPAWSPAGSLIAYLALNEGNSIKVMNPDGTAARRVSPAGSTYSFGGIDWSPDSQWIVARNANRNRLEVLNVTTGQTILLGATAGYNGPSWKP